MKKVLSHGLPLILAYFALIPPIPFRIPAPPGDYWPLMVTIAGFLGIRIIFVRTNIIIKFISVLIFITCFFSSIPYVSFNCYVCFMACCWFYIGLTRMDTWQPMFSTLKSLLVLNEILLVLQKMGGDRLLNFGLPATQCWGVVGQHMQFSSFAVILGAMLSVVSPLFFIFPVVVAIICNSTWAFFCGLAGLAIYFMRISRVLCVIVLILAIICAVIMGYMTSKFTVNLSENGRIGVWTQTLRLINDRPWTGWGPGTFKIIFPVLGDMPTIPWKTAHNCWIQFAMELGYPIISFILIAWAFVLYKTRRIPSIFPAFLIISLNMVVHFPTRMIQCVPIIICFLAYSEKSFHENLSIF